MQINDLQGQLEAQTEARRREEQGKSFTKLGIKGTGLITPTGKGGMQL